jgi:pentatricopeptide repeat protein
MYLSLKRSHGDVLIGDLTRSAKISPISFYTLVIQSVIRANKYDLLEEVLQDMADQGVERTLCFYESIMKQLAGQKQLRLALRIYDRLVAEGLEPSAVSYSCLISFAAEVGEVGRAIGFFEKLSELTTPSIRAYMTMLKIYSKMLNWPASLAILRDMQRRGVQVDTLAFNVLLGTGVSSGMIPEVEALVAEAEMIEPSPLDAVSYNTLMKGYVQHSHSDKALSVMRRMQRNGVTPSSITFHTAMDAAVRSSHTQATAWELLEMMQIAGLTPDNYTCSILVKGLSREATSSRVRVCLGILHEGMRSCSRSLQATLYNTVLEAAMSTGDVAVVPMHCKRWGAMQCLRVLAREIS